MMACKRISRALAYSVCISVLALVLSPSAGWSLPNGGSVRWCVYDHGSALCCGPWHDYGGDTGVTEDQASNAAWTGLQNSGCPGTDGMGSRPPYAVAGLGAASVDPYLAAGPFGVSGNDGIAFSPGQGVTAWGTRWNAIVPTKSGPDSAYLDISAAGRNGGVPSTLGYARYADAGGGQFKLDADLSATGVPSQVRCYSSGVFVASGPFQTSGRVGDVLSGGWPRGAAIYTGAAGSPSIALSWNSPISFRIRGDVNPTPCDSLIIVAVNGNGADLSSIQMRLKNVNALGLAGLDNGFTPTPFVPLASPPVLVSLWVGLAFLGGYSLLRSSKKSLAS